MANGSKWRPRLMIVGVVALLGFQAVWAADNSKNEVKAVEKDKLGWDGSGELGYVSSSGNNNIQTLTAKLHGAWKGPRWQHEVTFNALKASDKYDINSGNDADSWQIAEQSNYILSPINYLLVAGREASDRYATYDRQTVLAVGYGYSIIKRPDLTLDVEFGPGRRISRYADTGEFYNEFVTRFRAKSEWKIDPRLSWANKLTREAGPQEILWSFESGFKVGIGDNLAVKLLYSWSNVSNPAPGKVATNLLTTVNMVYSFK